MNNHSNMISDRRLPRSSLHCQCRRPVRTGRPGVRVQVLADASGRTHHWPAGAAAGSTPGLPGRPRRPSWRPSRRWGQPGSESLSEAPAPAVTRRHGDSGSCPTLTVTRTRDDPGRNLYLARIASFQPRRRQLHGWGRGRGAGRGGVVESQSPPCHGLVSLLRRPQECFRVNDESRSRI